MKISLRRLLGGLAAALLLAASTATVHAQQTSVAATAEKFAQLPAFDQLQMSPNGAFIAYLTPFEGRKVLMIQHRLGGSQVAVPFHKNADIDWFRWASNGFLLIGYSQTQIDRSYVRSKREKYMLAAIRRDGQNFQVLKQSGYGYYDLLPDDPNHILAPYGEDVVEFDLATGNHKVVQYSLMDIYAWHLDQQNEARYGIAEKDGETVPYYRMPDGEWQNVSNHEWANKGFGILGFFDDPQFAYGRGPSQHGTLGLFKVDMHSGKVLEEIYSHPKVDVDDLVVAPNTRRPIGVSYTLDHSEIFYWDDYYKKFHAFINRAIPDRNNLIVGKALDKKAYLILSRSDQEPGVYYHFDLAEKKLSQVTAKHPELDPTTLAKISSVSFTAQDGLEIPGYLTIPVGMEAKNLPMVIMPHGGPRSRSDAYYNYIVQAIAARGFAVFQPNFRGSTGYGPAFEAKGYHEWGGVMQRDVTDATHWLIKEGIADKNRICILGLSYGGYSALIGAAQNPNLYACAVSGNGVADLPFFIGDKQYKFIGGEDLEWVKDMHPKEGEPESVSPKHLADKFETPVLLIHAKDDARVQLNQSDRMYDALRSQKKDVKFVKIAKGTHWLVNREARETFLVESLTFLEKHLNTRVAAN
ncbi:alpha/beta hydrolase family protein [Kordiimonas lacus]|uniref:Dipeptidyl aminopeptidase/acylaminoacyl peptidase n=1 Tax=Kordiimonas lacus TaxID=637679 RepID=A0A1G6ZT93_9PROT|nr:prolyl oligopeptidase family serine peptidase [Kordiimonas lacus]SDE04766.1 Dipeptidyl aminopeptidase/acylaminoacyl peptidase [Kordiimonas lacus]